MRSPFDLVGGSPVTRQYRVSEIVHALDAAAADDRIKAVALDLDIFTGGGQTAIADVGAALDRFRRAGKRVVAYATGYGDDGYQLAAHADEIWLDPLGAVLIAGPGGANLYYAGLLERLGVTANVYRVGAFKSAVEPFTRSDMSPEARESAPGAGQRAVGELAAGCPPGAAAGADRRLCRRHRPASSTAAGGDMARAALRAGLVDRIGDRTQFGRRMAELAGTGDADHARQLPRGPLRGLGRRPSGRADPGGQIGDPHRRRRHRRRQCRPAPPAARRIARAISSAASRAATSRRWWSGSIRPAAR